MDVGEAVIVLVWVLLTHTSDVVLACGAAVLLGCCIFLMGWTALILVAMR